jgi:uncharacterized protein (TIGR03083 family)
MAKTDMWPAIHAERKALGGDLAALGTTQWSTPSLCRDWTVQDVLAHMTATAIITPATFFPKMIASGFSLTRMQAKDITKEKGSSPADTLARFEAVVNSKKGPPGPTDTMLGETIIHAEDIRRSLGLAHVYPTDAVVQVVEFYKNSNLIIGAKRRIAGLKLGATDTDWTLGAGPEVAGPVISLLMAMTGRKAVLDDLTGDGVELLRARP